MQVPPFVNEGDTIRVSTETGEYHVAGLRPGTPRPKPGTGPPGPEKVAMDVVRTPSAGWIEVIAGSMFSGKSEELIRRLRRAQIARQKVQIFKPAIDNRFADDHIVSHSEMRIPSDSVATVAELLSTR